MSDDPTTTDDAIEEHQLPTEYDAETQVERTSVGVTITTKVKRGTGTRDQDEHEIKAKGRTPAHAIDQHRDGMDYVEEEALDRAREFDPERSEDQP